MGCAMYDDPIALEHPLKVFQQPGRELSFLGKEQKGLLGRNGSFLCREGTAFLQAFEIHTGFESRIRLAGF